MARFKIAWKTRDNGLTPAQLAHEGHASDLIGFQEIGCHIIFDVKMDFFTWKARFIAGGHTTSHRTKLDDILKHRIT
jgi:hypothetical protein